MPEKSETVQEFLYTKNSTPQTHENMPHEEPPICDFSIVKSFQLQMAGYHFSCHPGFKVMFDMGSLLHLLAVKFFTVTQPMVGRMERQGAASPSAFLFLLTIMIEKKVIECLLVLTSAILKNRGDR